MNPFVAPNSTTDTIINVIELAGIKHNKLVHRVNSVINTIHPQAPQLAISSLRDSTSVTPQARKIKYAPILTAATTSIVKHIFIQFFIKSHI